MGLRKFVDGGLVQKEFHSLELYEDWPFSWKDESHDLSHPFFLYIFIHIRTILKRFDLIRFLLFYDYMYKVYIWK